MALHAEKALQRLLSGDPAGCIRVLQNIAAMLYLGKRTRISNVSLMISASRKDGIEWLPSMAPVPQHGLWAVCTRKGKEYSQTWSKHKSGLKGLRNWTTEQRLSSPTSAGTRKAKP